MRWIVAFITLVAVSIWVSPAPAESPSRDTIHVRDGSIQDAIDRVAPGGTVVIGPGVHRLAEPLRISGKRVRLEGAGSSGPQRTELVGPIPSEIAPPDQVRGLISYGPGGGGAVRGLMLRGFDAGIVGRARERALPLTLRDVEISDSGRGILWTSASDLTLKATKIHHTLWHGISWQGLGTLLVGEVAIFSTQGAGLAIFSDPGQCVTDLFTGSNAGAGIVVVKTSACIVGGVMAANHEAGIKLLQASASIQGTHIWDTAARADGRFGDGVVGVLSTVSVVGSDIERSARAGVSNFGGDVNLGANLLNCNTISLDGQDLAQGELGFLLPPAPASASFHDDGGNVCGCGDAEKACQVESLEIDPPNPIVPP